MTNRNINRAEISRLRMGLWETERKNKNKEIPKETLERQEIHQDIIEKIAEGKGKIETLVFLNNKYLDSKFAKYFEIWYDDHKKKEIIKKSSGDFTR